MPGERDLPWRDQAGEVDELHAGTLASGRSGLHYQAFVADVLTDMSPSARWSGARPAVGTSLARQTTRDGPR